MKRLLFLLFTALLAVPLFAQKNQEPTAPIPPLVTSAKRVFISNGGSDALAQAQFDPSGEPDEPYPSFYDAMRTWGKYELVLDPSEADLVFEVRASRSKKESGTGPGPSLEAQVSVTIIDAKTHFTVWTVSAPFQDAYLKSTWRKNFASGLADLMQRLKKITAPPSAKQTEIH